MKRREFLTAVGAAGSATVAASTPAAAAFGNDVPESLSPVAAAARNWSGFTLPDRTTRVDGRPRWLITATDTDAVADVKSWASNSEKRTVVAESGYAPVVTLAAPPRHVLGTNTFLENGRGLSGKSFVESVDVDLEIAHPEPVAELASESEWSSLTPKWTFDVGDLPRTGIAFRDNVQNVDAADVKSRMGETDVTHSAGQGITIAVLDTGCNYASGEFDDRLQHGKNFITGATIDPAAGDYAAIESPALHGSWCTTMAAGNSGFASSATIAHGKVLNDEGSGKTADIVEGIRWATEDVGADVLSLSLGSPLWSQGMADALRDAVDAGTVAFVATGNTRPMWIASPADVDGTIGIGASTTEPDGTPADLRIASFSQTGPDGGRLDSSSGASAGQRPQLVTPGINVSIPTPRPDGSVSPHRLSGTSMACPAAAGAATIFLSDHPDHVGKPELVRDRLTRTAARTPLIGEMEGGAGLLHLQRAYEDMRSEMDLSTEAQARDAALRASSGRWGAMKRVLNPTQNYLVQ